MATETVQKQNSKIKDTPEELMAKFESFTPEAKLDLIGSMGMYFRFQERDEKTIKEYQSEGMTREEAKKRLQDEKEKLWQERMKPKEKTEREKQQDILFSELSCIPDDIADHAGELQFLTTAIDKVLYSENVYGCDHAGIVLGRLVEAIKETGNKVSTISQQLKEVA